MCRRRLACGTRAARVHVAGRAVVAERRTLAKYRLVVLRASPSSSTASKRDRLPGAARGALATCTVRPP